MVKDLNTTVALLRRLINHHDSWIHRLPPEILAAMAFHLEDNTSLVAATHVCHTWRTTLLSYPRLWSHLDFENEEPALVFLERSKSSSLSVDLAAAEGPSEIVRELLDEIATRVITLWAEDGPFLDELLARPLPELEALEIANSREFPLRELTYLPSLTSLVISGLDHLKFHAPILTSFQLTRKPTILPREWAATILLDFLRSCPLLEVIFLDCYDPDANPDSDGVVSLPLLRSFTHESPRGRYSLYLFDRLSIPSTCRVGLTIDVTEYESEPWIPSLPTPRNSSYLSDIRTVKVTSYSHPVDDSSFTDAGIKVEFANSTHRTIAFGRKSSYSENSSDFSDKGFPDIFENIGIDSVEALCFDGYPSSHNDRPWAATTFITKVLRKSRNFKTLILAGYNITDSLRLLPLCPNVDTHIVSSLPRVRFSHSDSVINQLQEIAESRKEAGFPLKALTLVSHGAELRPSELERLRGCVEWVEVVRSCDWDIDEYLLTVTQEDDADRF